MKRFLQDFMWFFTLLIGWMLIVTVLIPNPKSPYSYMAGLKAKVTRLKSTEEPKIVLVGGSNLAYGIDSAMIEKALGMPVVNMGITAGLGFKYHLESVRGRLRRGDIVIAAPEYHHFQRDVFDGSLDLPEAIFEFDLESIRSLDGAHLLHLAKLIPEFASRKTIALFKVFELGKLKRRAQRWQFNEYGDFVSHKDDPRCAQPYQAGKTNAHPDPTVVRHIADFAEFLGHQGVAFILLPPPLQDSVFDADTAYIKEIVSLLAAEGIPFTAEPSRYRIPSASTYYDSAYHTTFEGAKTRSRLLIEDMTRCHFTKRSCNSPTSLRAVSRSHSQ